MSWSVEIVEAPTVAWIVEQIEVRVRAEEVSMESMGSHVCSCQLCTEGWPGSYGGTSWYVCD